nr:MAG TPA: hypothetical protein [Caudoviricetes sp.]
MYLKDLKNIAMQLIDEYSTEKSPTEDEDIKQKLNGLFNAALFEVAQIKKILKVYQFSITEEVATEYKSIGLPDDFMEERRLRYFSSNNSILRYYIQKDKIKIHKSCLGNFELEYYAIPEEITEDNQDDYEFELDMDAQMALPYYVASSVLMSDVSANYTAFEAKYNAKVEQLMRSAQESENSTTITIHSMFAI